jgi:heterodisulfide reductase subunit A
VNGALEIAYESEGKMMKEKYDLVILSTGQELTAETKALLALLNIEMDTYGFAATQAFEQYQTKTPGILIAGSVAEPKDIETAIIEARAAGFISDAAIPELKTPEGMAKDIDYRISKFGIFVCQCGGAMQKTVDTTKVVSAFVNAPDVAICEEIDLVCQEERLETIMKKVLQNGITRIIFATCSPAKYEVLIRKTAAQYGFNQAMIEVLSLREHIAWAFDHGAEEESIRRIRALMELLRLALPEGESQLKGLGNAIVIGGGIAGMVAAKQLSTRGVTVHLIEKADELGGNARNLFATLEGADVNNYLRALKDEIVNSKNITIHNNSEVVSLSGAAGAFVVGMGKGDESRSIAAGAIIVATGASEYKPKEYLFGTHERIVTQTQFEQLLASGDTKKFPASVIMIQCVGSRNSDHPWCSRVCCSDAIKNALLLKEKNPGAEIAVLYRDMMTYGKKELKFKEAREKGINFIRFRENDEPRISIDKANIVVKANDLILNRELKFEPDMVVLSAGVVPHNNLQLAAVLGVTLDEDGFFKGANPKFRPLESEKPGIFFAGLCRTPSSMGDCVTEATAAAGVAYTFLQERALVQRRAISEVIERWCAGCEFCVEVCPFDARYLDDEKKVVKVRVINCVGCGNCVSVCPSGAAKLRGLRDRQMLGVIDLSI